MLYSSLHGTVVLPVLDSTMSTVRGRQYRHNIVLYSSLQGTVVLPVLDSTMSTVCRQQYRPNGSTSKTQSKQNHHVEYIPSTQQSTLKPTHFKLTNKESTVLWVGKEEEWAKVPKNGTFNVVLAMTAPSGVLKQTKLEMWHFLHKITGRVLWNAIPLL